MKLPQEEAAEEVERWRAPKYEIIYTRTSPAQGGENGVFPDCVPESVKAMVTQNGERFPYSHQVEVARAALEELEDHSRANVIVVTPVASGKTIAFLTPVLSILQQDPNATAILVYPLNALAADQLRNLQDLGFVPQENPNLLTATLGGIEITVGVLVGETTPETRKMLRERARIILTNQISLHCSILQFASHGYADGSSWTRFLGNLKVLVFDEGHSQNGVPGSHTALALRRLWAMAEHASKKPFEPGRVPVQVIFCTATIGNPVEHATALTGLKEWVLVDRSGAACQERVVHVVVPTKHPTGGDKWSVSKVVTELAVSEIRAGRRLLIFVKRVDTSENIAAKINSIVGEGTCKQYHARLAKNDKAKLLQDLLNGRVQAVASTSALELGVDIGGLDTEIQMGHPGDHAGFTQRAGRVGRTSPGVVYLVLDEQQDGLNKYLEAVPNALFDAPEARTIYPDNPRLSMMHAACCWLETKGNREVVAKWFPNQDLQEVEDAAMEDPHGRIDMLGKLGLPQFHAFYPGSEKVLQTLGGEEALLNWHLDAVLRDTKRNAFRVIEMDAKSGFVYTEELDPESVRYTTRPRIAQYIIPVNLNEIPLDDLQMVGVNSAMDGDFKVETFTTSYKLIPLVTFPGGPKIQIMPLRASNPHVRFQTRGAQVEMDTRNPFVYWLMSLPKEAMGLACDVLQKAVPVVVKARPADVRIELGMDGGGHMHLVVIDFSEGGMGWGEALVRNLGTWLRAAGRLLGECRCKRKGCPNCSTAKVDAGDRMVLAIAMGRASEQECGARP